MGKAIGKIFKAVVGVALTALSIINPVAGLVIAVGTTLASSLLAKKPKAPTTSPETIDRLNASIDPRTPRKFVLGTTALATDIRDQEYTDSQTYLHRFIVVAAHKVNAISELWFDDKKAWSASGGVTSDYSGYLTVTTVLEGNAGNAINISARMGSTRRFTGCAYIYLRYKLTGDGKKTDSPFAQGIPTRMTIRGNGAYVYDPRKDSTVPGGSGSHRADDQSTWEWDANGSRNPALGLLFYLLGWRINGILSVGRGIPANRLDLESFITAANLCDETVSLAAGGTEPRYRCDGIFSENDSPTTVIDNFKAAMNADLDDVGGKLRLTVFHNDLADPVADFTDDDMIDGFKWRRTPSLDETFNVVRGSYTDPRDTALYQLVDYPQVEVASLDGIERADNFDLPLVQSPSQAQRLAKQRLQRHLYGGQFETTLNARGWLVQKNSVVTLTFSRLGWTEKLFRVAEMEHRVDGTCPIVLREENADIYAWDESEVPAVEAADPTVYDWGLNPIVQQFENIDQSGTKLVYKRSASQPTTPSPSASTPAGWYATTDDVPAGSDPIWMSIGTRGDVVLDWTWQEPVQIEGLDGAPGTNGDDGITYYTHYAYADAPDGTFNFTTGSPGDRTYQGVRYNQTSATESTNPADYAWSPYVGPPNFGLAAFNSNSVVAGNKLIKVAGAAWTGSIHSTESFKRGASVSFVVDSATSFVAGLNTDPTTDANWTSIDFAINPTPTNTYVYENGTLKYTLGVGASIGDVFTVTYNGRSVVYSKNGVAFYTNSSPAADLALFFDSSFNSANIQYGRILAFSAAGPAGADGTNGLNSAVVYLYQRGASAPAAPSGTFTYTFATGALSGGTLNGWTQAIPAANGSPLWVIAATASAAATTDSIAAAEFTSPVLKDGAGLNGAPVFLYKRAASAPSVPASTLTYTFATGVLSGTLGSWQQSVPANNGNPVYIITATALSTGTTDTIATGEWSTPQILAANGVNGRSLELAKSLITLAADYNGSIKAGQLPTTCKATFVDGGTDVSSSTSWSKSDNNTTSSISSSGLLTITAVTGAGYVDITGVYGGTTIVKRVTVEINQDSAPPQSGTSITTSTVPANVSTTTMPSSPTSNVVTMGTDASGALQGVLSLRYQVTEAAYSSARNATMKGQLFYRLAGSGGSWTAFSGGVVTGSSSGATWTIPDGELNKSEGVLNIDQSQTGLSATTNYEVGVAVVKSSGNGTALDYTVGTLTVNQL